MNPKPLLQKGLHSLRSTDVRCRVFVFALDVEPCQMERMKVSVSGKQFVFPRCCACCGGFPLVTLSVRGSEKNRLSRTKGWLWEVPYCTDCRAHVKRAEVALLGWICGIALAGLAGFGAFALGMGLGPAAILATTLSVTGTSLCGLYLANVRQGLQRDCCGILRAVSYLGSAGVCHSFDIRSRSYATEFIRANHRKIVNASPRVAKILRGLSFGDFQTPRRLIRHR